MAKADDLAAELAADLVADLEHDRALDRPAIGSGQGGQPSVEAALFLAPSTWQRPRVSRSGRSVTIGAGPLRVRIGRPRG